MKKKEPKSGWHNVYCFMCGTLAGRVTHKGGKKKLKRCGYCQDIPHYCFECWEEE